MRWGWLPAALILVAQAPSASAEGVDVRLEGDAEAETLAASVAGRAVCQSDTGACVAASLAETAHADCGSDGLAGAVSLGGSASSRCGHGIIAAASIFDDAEADCAGGGMCVAASLGGNATARCSGSGFCAAATFAGDASGDFAVTFGGDANYTYWGFSACRDAGAFCPP